MYRTSQPRVCTDLHGLVRLDFIIPDINGFYRLNSQIPNVNALLGLPLKS